MKNIECKINMKGNLMGSWKIWFKMEIYLAILQKVRKMLKIHPLKRNLINLKEDSIARKIISKS